LRFHLLKTPVDGVGILVGDCIEKVHYRRIHAAPLVLEVLLALDVLEQFAGCLVGEGEVDVEDEEAEDGQPDDGCHHRHDHDDCGLADVLRRLLDDEDDHVHYQQAGRQEDHRDEQHEVPVVSLTDASPHEPAVMVEYLNAVAAGRTVAGPLRPEDLTSSAETGSGGDGRVDLPVRSGNVEQVSMLVAVELEEGAFGDDAGVGAGSEVEEEVHEGDADEEDEGQGGIDLPVDADHEHAEGNSDAQRAAVDVEHSRQLLAGTSHAASEKETVARWVDLVYFRHLLFYYSCDPSTDPMHPQRKDLYNI
jgi:hypothetical protein